MKYEEVYFFDLSGHLLVRSLFQDSEIDAMAKAVDQLEPYFKEVSERPPNGQGQFGDKYYFDKETGASVYSYHNPGTQVIVDDCISASLEFDRLIGHPKLMDYVNDMVLPPYSITSTEIRYRYKDNRTTSHMGGPIDVRSRYHWVGTAMKTSDGSGVKQRFIDLVNLRMMIALHDIEFSDGPYCLVPGSHKANLLSPYGNDPHKEPGMQAILMKKGDVLFFTENMRHGGLNNSSGKIRRSIHLMYSQNWAPSQSQVHFNAPLRIHRKAWDRYSPEQKAFFPGADIVG